jgi:transcriptional regulator with XRE-family HTH domain
MSPNVFKALRTEHKVSIFELAEATGVSHEAIAEFELGESQLPSETLEMLCAAIQKHEKPCDEELVERLERYLNLLGED